MKVPSWLLWKRRFQYFGASFFERRDRGAVDEVDVQVAVVVVIEQGDARHHGLGLILVRRRRAVGDEDGDRLAGDLFEIESGPRRMPRSAKNTAAAISKHSS